MLYIALTVIFLGVILIVVGRTVAKKGSVSFVAGYNGMFVPKNETRLAKQIGLVISLFGVETVLFTLIYHFVEIDSAIYVGLAVFNLFLIFFFMIRDQLE